MQIPVVGLQHALPVLTVYARKNATRIISIAQSRYASATVKKTKPQNQHTKLNVSSNEPTILGEKT
jgi:hypothetical protein